MGSNKIGRKRTLDLVLGSLAMALGIGLGLHLLARALGTKELSFWEVGDRLLELALVVYLIWIGTRSIKRLGRALPRVKVGWGKLLAGCFIVYIELREHFVPSPDLLEADNAGEALGMMFAKIVLYIIGLALIVAAFRGRRKVEAEALALKGNSDEGPH